MYRDRVKILFALSLVLALGCQQDNWIPSKQDYEVAFLFDHEGCRVFRFQDPKFTREMRYFAQCRSDAAPVPVIMPAPVYHDPNNCIRPQDIPTVTSCPVNPCP